MRSTVLGFALGRLLQVIDGNGHAEQTYTYTPSGQIHTIKDANNNVTTYSYDGFDRLVATTYPDGSTETMTLDDAGRVLAVNTRAGQTITYAYDALDRLTQKNIPGGGQYTYAYDPANRIVNATGPGGPIQHAYDTSGRLLNVTYPGGHQVGYAYDAASRRTKLTYPDGSDVTYQYDRLGRLTLVNQDPDGTGELPATLAAGYTYDALSRRTRLTNGNGTLTDYAYSLDGNVLSIAHQWVGDAPTLNYTYDRTGLQTGYASDDDRFATLFNALGTKTNAPNNLNQYTTTAGQSLTYDQNGNLTGDGARTFTYDAANRLITAQAAQAATYAYDPFDRRGIKTVDSQTTTYIYDGDEVLAEYDGSGVVRKYVLGPGLDQPIMMEAGTNRFFYHANTLGSIIALTGTSGNVAETYQYSVFGEVNQASSLGNPYLFTGRSLDPETGLYYYRARYYDADLRRFLQPDPIGFAGGMNLYAYVGNSPSNWFDPFGLQVTNYGGFNDINNWSEYYEESNIYLVDAETAAQMRKQRNVVHGVLGALLSLIALDYLINNTNDTGVQNDNQCPNSDDSDAGTGTIYKVPGEATPSGKPYIGRHNQPNPQETRRSPDGRDRAKAEVIDQYDPNNLQEGSSKEQQAINKEGGVPSLDNKRNEIAPKKWKQFFGGK